MKTRWTVLVLLALTAPALADGTWRYPPTRTVDVKDTYFGKSYVDPYRWLENLKNPAVEAWFRAQAAFTEAQLERIPGRDALAQEWLALGARQPARYQDFAAARGRLFYKKTLADEQVGKLYVRDGWRGAERLLFDPSGVTTPGAPADAHTTVSAMSVAPDGKHVLLALTAAGSELAELRLLDVDSGELAAERWGPSFGPQSWRGDGKAFFYDAGPVTDPKDLQLEQNRQARMHVLGTPVAADVDMLSTRSHPELGLDPAETPEVQIDAAHADWALGLLGTSARELHAVVAATAPLAAGKPLAWRPLATRADALVGDIFLDGPYAYALSHARAEHNEPVRTRIDRPDWTHAETVIPEAKDTIFELYRSRRFLVLVYSDGIVGRLVKYELATGRSAPVPLPGHAPGGVTVRCPERRSDRCIAVTTSWIEPSTRWQYDADQDRFTRGFFTSDVTYPGIEELVTEEVEVPGQDGTPVPLSIIHRRDLKLDGTTPTVLMGYGAYGRALQPSFSVHNLLPLHHMILATAHVRGGGEKGQAWYRGGYKTTKANTWKDFIACAEYLVKKGYTSPAKLAGIGSSAGGILISRAITERPDLFAAAVCNVGDCDAMRAEFTPDGPRNAAEYGTLKDERQAAALYEMDGMMHVRRGVAYPALLGVGGWNDALVPVWQPGKLVAAVQNASRSTRPALLQVNFDNGHSTEDKTEDKLLAQRNFASQYAFMLWQLGHPEFQPRSP